MTLSARLTPLPAAKSKPPAGELDRLRQLEILASRMARDLRALEDGIAEIRRRANARRGHAKTVAGEAAQANEPLKNALARGEALKVEWVQSGQVVPAKVLASAWGLTPQALGPAANRGELFAVLVKRGRYYPKEFLTLDRESVAQVNQALGPLSPSEKLVFWTRPHGALGGARLLEALAKPKALPRVVQLAEAWARERRG